MRRLVRNYKLRAFDIGGALARRRQSESISQEGGLFLSLIGANLVWPVALCSLGKFGGTRGTAPMSPSLPWRFDPKLLETFGHRRPTCDEALPKNLQSQYGLARVRCVTS
jgi:hypothetical protein